MMLLQIVLFSFLKLIFCLDNYSASNLRKLHPDSKTLD